MNNTITNPPQGVAALGAEQLAEGYAVKALELKRLEPLVSPPRLKDFEISSPPLFPGFSGLANPATSPPAGIESLRDELPAGVAVNLNRAAVAMEASAVRSEEGTASVTEETMINESTDAAEAAAITRDQIRYEPRQAMQAQANSNAQNVLAVLK